MNLERTLRISTGTMRWRIKYMIIGLDILFAVRCYTSTQTILYSAVNMDLASLRAGALIVGCMFACLSLVRGSFAAVDLYPSHGVLYGSVTMLLAGAYLMVVGVFAEVVAYFGWGQSFPLAAFLVLVSLVGVTIILLSDRLRQRIKRFVSRHFHRPQYDYRRVWSMFSERTVALTDAGDFCRAVTRVISETFDLLSVTIWLVDEAGRRYVLGGSTALAEAEAKKLIGTGKVSGDILRLLREHAYPTPVEGISGEFGSFLRQLGHKEFEHGGEYFFLPLTTSEEVLGILVLGDRVSGLPFTIEEIDLLKTIGNQTVANLLSIKLSGRLVEAQKLEAFQTMSAFFVHDLKNTASTLSLMLQNLPRHFDDPAFRQDALRAISKSVDKINGLIGRLTFFRQKIEIKPLAGDLNQVVKSTLTGLAGFDGERLTTELRPLPAVLMDAEQIQKVITNLLLNARDASAETGRIELQTLRSDGWVVLTVSDRGCGMSPEFIEQSLFRPFQTTKQDGIGIGLFHSKMIVEAHRGRIDVESRPGEGSTFRVFLPVQGVTR
jgi:putative PEP-CTERM system histidine kinase